MTVRHSLVALFGATALLGQPAMAETGDKPATFEHWQVKLLASAVLPDGHVTHATGAADGILSGANVTANNNYVPTVALEYFLTPDISLETICCGTGHHITGTGTLAGVSIVDHTIIVPFTLAAKYHVNLGAVRPYVGAGPALIVAEGERPSAAVQALGLTHVSIPAKFGGVLQAGVDVPLPIKRLSLTFDAKRYFVRPTAHFANSAGDTLLSTTHKLDPWLLSAGFGYRF